MDDIVSSLDSPPRILIDKKLYFSSLFAYNTTIPVETIEPKPHTFWISVQCRRYIFSFYIFPVSESAVLRYTALTATSSDVSLQNCVWLEPSRVKLPAQSRGSMSGRLSETVIL